MLRRAAEEHCLDLTRCAVVGDVGATDMLAAHAVGAIKVLVRTGWGESSLVPYRDRWAGVEPDYVAENLLDAARWLIRGCFPFGRRPSRAVEAPSGYWVLATIATECYCNY